MTETTVSSSAKETKYLEKKGTLPCNAAASSKVTPTSFKMDLNWVVFSRGKEPAGSKNVVVWCSLYVGIERKTSLQVDVIVKLYELRNPSLRALLQNAFGILLKPPAEPLHGDFTTNKKRPWSGSAWTQMSKILEPSSLTICRWFKIHIRKHPNDIHSTSRRFNESIN